MSALNYDIAERLAIKSVKGQTDKVTLTITNADGSAASLTGNTFVMTIHANDKTATALATINGTISGNVVTLSLTSANAGLAVGEYYYRIARTYATSEVVRVLAGKYNLVI